MVNLLDSVTKNVTIQQSPDVHAVVTVTIIVSVVTTPCENSEQKRPDGLPLTPKIWGTQ